MRSLNCSTTVQVKEIIHDTVTEAFDSAIKVNDILMTNLHGATLVGSVMVSL